MRAGLYVRVSGRGQTAENQERELRAWADRSGYEVVRVYTDTISGARPDRAGLRAAIAGAHQRDYDVLLVWALDRLSREGIAPMLRHLEELRALGVRVRSCQESWVDTSSPLWDLLVAVFAWVAKQERERIGERVRAGQARARALGVRFGRKPRVVDLEELRRRREAGWGWRRIARAMKAPTSTLRRKWEECQKSPAAMTHAHARLAGVSEGTEGEAAG